MEILIPFVLALVLLLIGLFAKATEQVYKLIKYSDIEGDAESIREKLFKLCNEDASATYVWVSDDKVPAALIGWPNVIHSDYPLKSMQLKNIPLERIAVYAKHPLPGCKFNKI